MKNVVKRAITYGLYPFLLATTIAVVVLSMQLHWDYKKAYGIATLFLVLVLVIVERIFPLSDDWSMSGRNFLRDLKYIAIDAPVIALTRSAFGMLAIYYSEKHTGIFSHAPLLLSVIGFLLVFEFFQYWYHRLSHTANGRAGKFLWRVHLAHHLPDKVYVVMHAVFHPLNIFISTVIIQIPLVLLGISPEAALAATLLIDLQSFVSHFNVDIKAGFLNYIFIGTETHRYHHSVDVNDAKNYGNTLAIWDIVFGTFHYTPGRLPVKLGVGNMEAYPPSEKVFRVIAFPFKKQG